MSQSEGVIVGGGTDGIQATLATCCRDYVSVKKSATVQSSLAALVNSVHTSSPSTPSMLTLS